MCTIKTKTKTNDLFFRSVKEKNNGTIKHSKEGNKWGENKAEV